MACSDSTTCTIRCRGVGGTAVPREAARPETQHHDAAGDIGLDDWSFGLGASMAQDGMGFLEDQYRKNRQQRTIDMDGLRSAILSWATGQQRLPLLARWTKEGGGVLVPHGNTASRSTVPRR
ncbi:hypothetical protein E4U42_002533 [Claviceps africana]|uniref:Uncharacterized protein n=1 Tax=Claviceps africana TaxID=83212 RepID=A0A8K0JE27_9HYPO|nr:hypothetical protein E4U42_002533 [Claviceps africana]